MDQVRPGRAALLQGVLLVVLAVLAFLPAIRSGFIWDDDSYVTANPTLQDGRGLWRIWSQPGAVPQYYPLVHTTFWIEHHLWGLRPAGYHAVNLLLHAAACLLLWACLKRLRIPGAWAAAALYALHPLQVESVAWITERKNVLSGLFFWASLLALLKGRQGKTYAWSLVFFVCALLSKTVAGVLPVAFLLATYAAGEKLRRSDLYRLAPFVLIAVILGAVTIVMEQRTVGAVGAEWALPLVQKLAVAGRILWFYPWKLIWPASLAFIYPRWDPGSGVVWGLLGLAAFALLLALLVRFRKVLGRGPLAAVLFYAAAIFPALGFVRLYPMRYSWVADHFQYLAGAGVIVLAAGAVAAALSRRGTRRAFRYVLLGVFLAALGAASFHRTLAFHDEETLWRDDLQKNPQGWMAHHNLARYYEAQGRTEEAIAEYQAALLIRPDLDNTLYNLGSVLAARGERVQAEAFLRRAVAVNPRFVEAFNNLGNVLYQDRKAAEAVQAYRAAVSLDPSYAEAQRNLGYALADQGDFKGAEEHLEILVRLMPGDAVGWNRLGWLLAVGGDSSIRNGARAVECASEACRLSGFSDPAHLATLAAAYAEAGRFSEAIETARRGADLFSRTGREDQAVRLRDWIFRFEAGNPIRVSPPAAQQSGRP